MAPFHSSRLKIERAKKHINDLHERILAFAATDSYRLIIESDLKTGDDVLQIAVTKSLPEDFALILGDALHNLKASLDLAVNEIVFRRTRTWNSYTRFPVAETRDKLVATVKGGTIRQASEAVADLIVDVIKPYNGGNDALWALHNLNILDKHRLLLPVLHVSAVHDIRVEDETGEEMRIKTWVFSEARSELQECTRSKQLKITNYGHPSLLVLFDRGLPMEGEAVVKSLIHLTESVSSTLEGIETVFLAEKISRHDPI